MLSIEKLGTTLGSIENQNAENHNKKLKMQLSRTIPKGYYNQCLKLLTDSWITYILRLNFECNIIIEKAKQKEKEIFVYSDKYGDIGWQKKDAPKITNEKCLISAAKKIKKYTITYLGNNVIEDPKSYIIVATTSEKTHKTKTKSYLVKQNYSSNLDENKPKYSIFSTLHVEREEDI